MWTVVYVAPSPARGRSICEVLAREGILATLRVASIADSDGASGSQVEILVPEGEAEDAHQVLCNALTNLRRVRPTA